MKRRVKNSKLLKPAPILGLLAGLLVFVALAIVANDNLSATNTDAGYLVCRSAGTTATLTSSTVVPSGASATVSVFKSNGVLTYNVYPKLSTVSCAKKSGFFTCAYKSSPLNAILYSSAYVNSAKTQMCFYVK